MYCHRMLQPVLQAQDSGGIIVNIEEPTYEDHTARGGRETKLLSTKFLYPVVPFIIGDNEELSRLSGVKTGSNTYKQCRCCLCPNNFMHCFKDHRNYIWRNQIQVIQNLSRTGNLPKERRKYLIENSLYDVQEYNFLFQKSNDLFGLQDRGTAFYEAFPPDNLHTLLAGVMRYTVCWTLEIIKLVSGKKGLTLLDRGLLNCNVGAATDSEFEFKVPSMVC